MVSTLPAWCLAWLTVPWWHCRLPATGHGYVVVLQGLVLW